MRQDNAVALPLIADHGQLALWGVKQGVSPSGYDAQHRRPLVHRATVLEENVEICRHRVSGFCRPGLVASPEGAGRAIAVPHNCGNGRIVSRDVL